MVHPPKRAIRAGLAGGLAALAAGALSVGFARADDATAPVVRPPAAAPSAPVRRRSAAAERQARRLAPPPVRVVRVFVRPLTIRRPPPIDFVEDDLGYVYVVPQHGWNDPRLYYFGPFRTGGEVFYGDQAGNPITRGNAGLGMISGYGPARGGYGGPHFDAVGGFHDGPGPDAKIDADYASGSLSRPDFAVPPPRYPSVPARVATLDRGVVPDRPAYAAFDRAAGRKLVADERSNLVAADAAKAAFSAPMRREAPIEAAFSNGGLGTAGFQIGNGEF